MKPPTKKSIDVLGLGCAAVDDFVFVPSYPAADNKVRVEKWHRQCGGLTGNALVSAARLGAHCAFAGCLGTDELSDCVANNFLSEGVDVSNSPRFSEGGVVHSTIVVAQDTGSRNIFYEVRGVMGAHPSQPAESVIGDALVLFIDHYGMPGNLRAIKCARRFGVPVVADIEDDAVPLFEEVLYEVDHLILSEEFACPLTRKKRPLTPLPQAPCGGAKSRHCHCDLRSRRLLERIASVRRRRASPSNFQTLGDQHQRLRRCLPRGLRVSAGVRRFAGRTNSLCLRRRCCQSAAARTSKAASRRNPVARKQANRLPMILN